MLEKWEKKTSLWTIILLWLFFGGEQDMFSPQQIHTFSTQIFKDRRTQHDLRRKFWAPKKSYGNLKVKGTATIGIGSCMIHCVESSSSSIGARQSSKSLIEYNHLLLLWAAFYRGYISHFFSDVLHRHFFSNPNSENIAMKHESHCTVLLHPTHFNAKFQVPDRSFFSSFYHLSFFEVAVEWFVV